MKHLKQFENFDEQDKSKYDALRNTKEDFENSDSFKEMSEKEQEILSDAYSKESETIGTNESLDSDEKFEFKLPESIEKIGISYDGGRFNLNINETEVEFENNLVGNDFSIFLVNDELIIRRY